MHGDLPSYRRDLEGVRQRVAIEIFEDGAPSAYVSPTRVATTAYWDTRKDTPLDQPIRCRPAPRGFHAPAVSWRSCQCPSFSFFCFSGR